MAFAEDLLDQAERLARLDPTKPKQASLRRAVSTAYYALFHLLITDATKNWKRAAFRASIGRAFELARMKAACERKRKDLNEHFKANPLPGPQLTVYRHLHRVADTFIEMQQHRHTADYDSSTQWSRTETIAQVDAVAAAFESWKAIRKETVAQAYLVSLLVKDRH